MGRAISKLKHPFRDFNVESRAHKVIGQPNKIPAPKHEKDALDLERLKREYPDVFEESLKKNEVLDKRLKDVFVVSRDELLQTNDSSKKQLPQDRRQPDTFLFGLKEPDTVPAGKTTLRNALHFISKHQSEPTKYTSKFIAAENKVPEEIIQKVLQYYRVFEIYMPESYASTKANFAGPSLPKVTIIKQPKHLPAPESKNLKEDT